jgi:hypothetical protein
VQSESERRKSLDELKRHTRDALREGCANLSELEPLSRNDPAKLLEDVLGVNVLPEGTITVSHIGGQRNDS